MKKVVIIGNGIAGITAARHVRKRSDYEILVISKESPFFFSRTALMYVYMGHMTFDHLKPYEDFFWKKNRIQLKQATVSNLDFTNKKIELDNSSWETYDDLIIASGSTPNKFGWPGENLKGVQGLYSKQDLESLEEQSSEIKTAVVVGGGLIGIELVEMLLSRNIKVHFVVRENSFWNNVLPAEESKLITEHIKHHRVELILGTELKEVIGNSVGRVESVLLSNGNKIDCQFVGLTVGVRANIDFLKNSDLKINRGILVDDYLKTSIDHVYAIGDCAEIISPIKNRRSIEQVWYTGRIMGETVAATICGEQAKYNPGIWFNSAKFFDIEYQTYGTVHSQLTSEQEDLFWKSEKGSVAIHLVWNKNDKKFVGVNSFNWRLRHEIFENWLKNEMDIEYVLSNLSSANFDPEFYRKHEADLIAAYNTKFSKSIKSASKKWWQKIVSKA